MGWSRVRRGPWRAALALAAALGAAPPAAGQNTDLNELGSLLVLPVIARAQGTATLATVTNLSSQPILLALDFISGDPGGSWQSVSTTCALTGLETTTFVIESTGPGNSSAAVECSGLFPFSQSRFIGTGFEQGILVAAVADETAAPGQVLIQGADVLAGDAVVVDLVAGEAYSFGAIPFQQGGGGNDGDKVYRFDGQEYAHFPGALATTGVGDVILFTLDGTLGSFPPPRARVTGGYQREFECFTIFRVERVCACSRSGPPPPPTTPTTTSTATATIPGAARCTAGSWRVPSPVGRGGRSLIQSTTALVPLGTDVVVLDAD